jgi:lipase maturation factor 1
LLEDSFFPYEAEKPSRVPPPRAVAVAGWSVFALAVIFSVLTFCEQFRPGYPEAVQSAVDRVQAFKVVSSYGVFRVMTKTRPEIIIEGSDDGLTWKPYELKWKPGRVDRRPVFVAPWQPRLDWQAWFAAMGSCEYWVQGWLTQLLLGTPEVLALMEENPFPAAPPRMLRSTLWQYRFAPAGSSDWWTRTEVGPYCPTVMLDAGGRLIRAQ